MIGEASEICPSAILLHPVSAGRRARRLGSGARGIAFLIERDGFLFQSPIAWFAQRRRWDISPGYGEFDPQPDFERPIQPECLSCHANRFRPVAGTLNRYEPPLFQGHAIGCERCHGPGALHVDPARPSVVPDLTIVNPARLSHALRESVCQRCHLQGAFRFTRAGREVLDFRPGLPIQRFWAFFMRKAGNRGRFEAVGHVEQMESSPCFLAIQGQLGCISCHDPHRLPAPSAKAAYYRERCLACHERRGCALPPAERRARGLAEDCVACHMPRPAISDIPHTAATDHRIPRGVPGAVVEEPRG
jgi:predicted CXXCH cytochrome family protein